MSANIKVELDEKEIEAQVVRSILDSGIGKAMAESVKRVLPELTSHYKNSLDTYVKESTSNIIRNMVEVEYAEEIRNKVREALTTERIQKLVAEVIDGLTYKNRGY